MAKGAPVAAIPEKDTEALPVLETPNIFSPTALFQRGRTIAVCLQDLPSRTRFRPDGKRNAGADLNITIIRVSFDRNS